jgi:hypothetical protein
MAANIIIKCPQCDYQTSLRFDPGPENDAPAQATAEVNAEHPTHDSKSWKFRNLPLTKED